MALDAKFWQSAGEIVYGEPLNGDQKFFAPAEPDRVRIFASGCWIAVTMSFVRAPGDKLKRKYQANA